jgi:hypothetical protein
MLMFSELYPVLFLLHCPCSFVKELQSLRRKLESSPDAAAEFQLVALVQALTSCVSSLKEGIHDAVLTTLLSISFWSCTKVGAAALVL